MTKSVKLLLLFILVLGMLSGADCVLAQTWISGGGGIWTDADSDDFNPQYDNGDTATFTTTGNGTVTIDAGGVTPGAVVVSSGTYTFTGGSIGGTGSLTKDGSESLTLISANSYSGATTINVGTLKLGAAGDGTASALGTIAAGTSVTATGGALDLNGITLTTAEALSLIGTGVGSTGALSNSGAAASYSGIVTIGATGASIGGTGNITLSAALANTANLLTKVGAGKLTLTTDSLRTGSLKIDGGTVRLESAAAFGSTTSTITIISGTLEVATTASILTHGSGGYRITLNNGGTILNGLNGGTTSIIKFIDIATTGTPVVTFNSGTNASNILSISDANGSLGGGATGAKIQIQGSGAVRIGETSAKTTSVTWDWVLQGGSLRVWTDASLGNTANDVYFEGGTLYQSGAFTMTAGRVLNFNHASGGTVNTTGGSLTLGTAGQLVGANPLTKAGSNSLIISAANSGFSGNVTISGGLLSLGNDLALGSTSGQLTVNSGGTLNMAANSITVGNLTGSGVISGTSGTRTLTIGQGDFGGGNFQGQITDGAGGTTALTKIGTGTITLSGANTFTGATTINSGTLEIGVAGLLGGGSYAANITNTAAFRYNSTAVQTISGIISGSGGTLTKDNTGTLILSANNTYDGTTTISAGTLFGVVGGSCANSAVTADNATLGVYINDNTKQWTCASLETKGASPQLCFNFGTTTPSSSQAPLNIAGTCLFTTTPTIKIYAASAGTYPLLVCGGTAPTAVPTVTIAGSAGTLTGTASWDGGNTLSVTVTGTSAQPLTWNGGNTGTWDINNLTVWKDATGTPGVKYQDDGVAGDQVQFTDNSLTAAATVTLNTTVKPASVAVNNSTQDISISGTGGIAGTSGLSKSGARTLILSGTGNTYSGTTTLNAGTLQGLVTGTSLNPVSPFGTGTILLNGGRLELMAPGSINVTAETINFGNNVTVGGNATIYAVRPTGFASSAKTISLGTLSIGSNTLTIDGANIGYYLAFSGVILTGDVIFSFEDQYLPLTVGAITQIGGARSLTKAGNAGSTLRLAGSSDYTGATTISSGTLQLGNGGATGSLTGTSAIINNGNLTINRTNTFTQATDLNNKAITGIGSFTQAGSGTTTLSLANSFTGSNTVSGGTLVLAGSSCLSDTNVLSIATGKFVQLEAGVKEQVGILKLNNVQQSDGIWGATGNTKAQYNSSYLLGTGLLYVNTDLPPQGTLITIQ